MYADLDRIARGSKHAAEAADHVHEARGHLRSVAVSAGMFGRTEAAANTEDVLSRAHDGHIRALDDRHRSLTRVGERTAEGAATFGEADLAGGAAVRAGHTADR